MVFWRRLALRLPLDLRAAGSTAPPADCWCGDAMSAVPLIDFQAASVAAERSVTILGATGSIGRSTVDLLVRERAQFRVEAVTALRNAAALAHIARDLGARFAAIADPARYAELKRAL